MTALLLLYINNNIVSISAKQDLRVEGLPVENNDVNEGICSFTLEGIGRLDTHVIVVISAQSAAFTVKFAKNRNGRQTAPVGSKVKCRLAQFPLPADARTFISPKHFLTTIFSHSSISSWHFPPLLISQIFLWGRFWKKMEPRSPTPPGNDRLRLRLFKCTGSGLRALGSGLCLGRCSAGCTWFRDTYLIRLPCPCNCSLLCEPEVYLKGGGQIIANQRISACVRETVHSAQGTGP